MDEHKPDEDLDGHEYAEPLLKLKEQSPLVRDAMLALPRWITPNGVTIFRGLLIVPIAWFLVRHAHWPAAFVVGFAMILDFVDGALATARNEETTLGAFLDPLADKVLVWGTLSAVFFRLPFVFQTGIVICAAIAALLTLARVAKMWKNRKAKKKDKNVKAPDVAAKSPGKLKLLTEVATMLCTIIGLAYPGTAGKTLVWIGFIALLFSFRYAVRSLVAQWRGV